MNKHYINCHYLWVLFWDFDAHHNAKNFQVYIQVKDNWINTNKTPTKMRSYRSGMRSLEAQCAFARKINSPQLRSCSKLMQSLWSHSCLTFINMHRYRNYFHICFLNLCMNNVEAGSCCTEKLHGRVSSCECGKSKIYRVFVMISTPKWVEGLSMGVNFGVVEKLIPKFLTAVHWSNFNIWTILSHIDKTRSSFSALYFQSRGHWNRCKCVIWLNVGKTEFMWFTTARQQHLIDHCPIASQWNSHHTIQFCAWPWYATKLKHVYDNSCLVSECHPPLETLSCPQQMHSLVNKHFQSQLSSLGTIYQSTCGH